MIGASVWWFWMLIPAFAMMGEGISIYIRAMEEKNIDIRDHFPKGLRHLGRAVLAHADVLSR